MNSNERKLFLSICLPSLPKGTSEGLKGELLYGLKNGKINESLLEDSFPNEYSEAQEIVRQRPVFNFFDKKNYLFDYFFKVYNEKSKHKVVPGHLVGFKAERVDGKNKLQASIKLPNGNVKNADLEMSPILKIDDINFNSHVLIHHNTICLVLTEPEYKEIIETYYKE